ncbi:MAG TPA: hypothetical protein DCG19_10065 [Cryomorphaceae bacterium]|nr:hypothetical protein [Owenweeksia sp.]HAD97740.1 hypothetical protein [Cryomorphaceae bacterium]HBF18790.1 hypothetical protein [Cryomorphaceae bacterium]|tara:strand:+ start:370 stop:645 length:276 start_codon:yes stop_codon:yes gene_type:complete
MNIKALTEDEFNRILHQIAEIKEVVSQKIKNEQIVYDNSDVIRLLKVSSRTLSYWRETGVIRYSKIGAKIYYRKQDIEDMLERGMSSEFGS